ncbi:hypothetical protein F3Y22_tig00116951pilonHSYRG00771 [Hibiscus syriacus]|uniref:Uncharacterized protein n=1 Tax=Hibiscus syriacus TaxID=106335 RepID=A0A6A2Y076_HIBSY|nr:hypothetical protein F3Y22_tig00116951pilonHSYRG00771 [Hibiscus syriacus]
MCHQREKAKEDDIQPRVRTQVAYAETKAPRRAMVTENAQLKEETSQLRLLLSDIPYSTLRDLEHALADD